MTDAHDWHGVNCRKCGATSTGASMALPCPGAPEPGDGFTTRRFDAPPARELVPHPTDPEPLNTWRKRIKAMK